MGRAFRNGCHLAMVGEQILEMVWQQILQWVEGLEVEARWLVALEVRAPWLVELAPGEVDPALALGKVVAGGTHLGSGSWGLELAPGWLELVVGVVLGEVRVAI